MMPSKKRGRDGSEIKRPTKRTKLHRDNFLKRERERLEHERESDSLKLIAEIQKNERETRLQKKEQEIKNIMMCINLEHEDALQNAKSEFNKRKNVSDIDRERLKQDLEFIDSRYDDMRSQCLKNMKDKEEDNEETTVNSMANWLMGAFRDNPWLLDFLKASLKE